MAGANVMLLLSSIVCSLAFAFAQMSPSTVGIYGPSSSYGCPHDVAEPKIFYRGNCYRFVSTPDMWTLARSTCMASPRGRLVNVPDAETQSWLEAQMSIRGWTNVPGVWLGLNNRNNQGFSWHQTDHGVLPVSYTNWHPATNITVLDRRDCVYMSSTLGWKWAVDECHGYRKRYNFICQYPNTSTTVTTTTVRLTTAAPVITPDDARHSESSIHHLLSEKIEATVATQSFDGKLYTAESTMPATNTSHVFETFSSTRAVEINVREAGTSSLVRNIISTVNTKETVDAHLINEEETTIDHILHATTYSTFEALGIALNGDGSSENIGLKTSTEQNTQTAAYTVQNSNTYTGYRIHGSSISTPESDVLTRAFNEVTASGSIVDTISTAQRTPIAHTVQNSNITTDNIMHGFAHPTFETVASLGGTAIAFNEVSTAGSGGIVDRSSSEQNTLTVVAHTVQKSDISSDSRIYGATLFPFETDAVTRGQRILDLFLYYAATAIDINVATESDIDGDRTSNYRSTRTVVANTVKNSNILTDSRIHGTPRSTFEAHDVPRELEGGFQNTIVSTGKTPSLLRNQSIFIASTLPSALSNIFFTNTAEKIEPQGPSTSTDGEEASRKLSGVTLLELSHDTVETHEHPDFFSAINSGMSEATVATLDSERILKNNLISGNISESSKGTVQQQTTEISVSDHGVELFTSFSLANTEDIFLRILVNGGWSAWSSWSTCGINPCSAASRLKERHRSRECNSPAPRNHGRRCDGLALEAERCDTLCSILAEEATSGSTVKVSCANRTNHQRFVLRGTPTGYSVGERFVDAFCTAEQPLITWKCTNTSEFTAIWSVIGNESCPRNEQMQRLALVNVTIDTVSSILRDAVNATSSSAGIGHTFGLAVDDITSGSLILTSAVSLVVQEPQKVALSEVITAVPAIVSKLLEAPAESLAASNTSSSISRNVEALLNVAAAELQENSTVTHVQPNLIVQMTSDPAIVGIEVISDGALNADTVRPVRAGDSSGREHAEAVVFFATEAKDIRKSFAVFNNSKLFQGKKMFPASEKIISAQLTEKVSHPELVTILFKLPTVQNQSARYEDVECGFWNYIENDWSTFGCKKMPASYNRMACFCNHTTNFAVLFRVQETSIIETVHSFVLSTITRVGLSVSISLLLVVIISFLLLRKLRRTSTQKVLFNIALSIFLLDLLFLIGIERTENTAACIAFAALIHMFLLSSFTWMSVEATLQYLKLVKIFAAIPIGFFTKSAIFAWGLPVLIVGSILIADIRFYDKTEDDICWIQSSVMHYGVLLPVSLSIVYNGIMFSLIARSLILSKSQSVRSTMSATERLKLRARASFAVFVLLGLTWTFGYFAIHGAELAFHYLFCLFNSIQGALIALFHCILGKLLPRELRRLVRRSSSKDHWSGDSRTTTISSSLKSSVNRRTESTKL